jgi:hypothetical protein
LEEVMATQPKPKPRPEPDPPEPKPEPGEDDAATTSPVIEEPKSLSERIDAIFVSQVALIERVEKLEERVAAPPIGLGRRP